MDELLPLARKGLDQAQVATEDIDKYLAVIRERVESRQTGARWIVKSLAAMPAAVSKDARDRTITAAMLEAQKEGRPVHQWPITSHVEGDRWADGYRTVGQFMTTDLFTLHPDDLVDLAASVMDWRHIRHVPVEDAQGRLVGLVTHRALLRLVSQRNQPAETQPLTVRELMIANPVTVDPTTSSTEAVEIMRGKRIGCLPVVEGDQLVGIVTSFDFLEAAAQLFQQKIGEKTLSAHSGST